MLPRLLIIYTGGTFGMEINKTPSSRPSSATLVRLPDLSPRALKESLFSRVPDILKIARCDVQVLFNRDSAHIGPDEWAILAKTIHRQWKKYKGIVILHGTDTLAYTASALSFLLRPCLKPIVITGAQRPLSAIRSDARANLVSAAEIAVSGPKNIVNQVTVFFGSKLFQGNQVRKESSSDYEAFTNPHFPPLARVGTTTQYFPKAERKKWDITPKLKPVLSRQVLLAHITPGFPAQSFTQSLLTKLDAIVLIVFASGTAPTHDPNFIYFLRAAKARKIPVVVVTDENSVISTQNTAFVYSAGKQLMEEGCISAGRMTPECAYVKTCLILGQLGGVGSFQRLWNRNLAGER
jgi:L-asparaginase